MPTRRTALSLASLLLAGAALGAQGMDVHVAVAANFAGPMARIAEAFQAESGHMLKVSAGSTGKLATQIRAGAPFEVFIAADEATPARLIAEGHAVAGSAFPYAVGRLVLWSARPGLVDAEGALLTSGRFERLAIANPKTAPYGRAAMEVLTARGLDRSLASRLVTGQSVAQAYQFVASGNAEIGFVAWSEVARPGQPVPGSHWLVPPELHHPIRQDAVLLKAGHDSVAARALLSYLRSARARALIQDFGYELPAP